jgi:hypothetical protein
MFDEPAFGPGALPDEDDPSLPLLHQIVYCSRAAPGVDGAAVDTLVAGARRHNAQHGITGLLVVGSGIFFQWLEGPRAPVQRLMQRIAADGRHTDVVRLSEEEDLRERLFPAWDMEQVAPEDIRAVLEDALDNAEDPQHQLALGQMLALLDGGPLQSLGRR